jgi:Rieske Fe-S protein
MLLGFGRQAWAQVARASTRFSPLTTSVRIPLDAVTVPWRPVPFAAEGVAPPVEGKPGRRVLMSGVLFRRAAGDDAGGLSALCLTCPHEQCHVELVDDSTRLAALKGGVTTHPMFVCGCHASVFDALADGAWVDGPAPRGLYRFRSRVADGRIVEINGVEETALFEV